MWLGTVERLTKRQVAMAELLSPSTTSWATSNRPIRSSPVWMADVGRSSRRWPSTTCRYFATNAPASVRAGAFRVAGADTRGLGRV